MIFSIVYKVDQGISENSQIPSDNSLKNPGRSIIYLCQVSKVRLSVFLYELSENSISLFENSVNSLRTRG